MKKAWLFCFVIAFIVIPGIILIQGCLAAREIRNAWETESQRIQSNLTPDQ